MAHFRGIIQGNRGEASRLGSARSGLQVTANGWNVGARVYLHAGEDGDTVTIYLTAGSNGAASSRCLGTFRRADLSPAATPTAAPVEIEGAE